MSEVTGTQSKWDKWGVNANRTSQSLDNSKNVGPDRPGTYSEDDFTYEKVKKLNPAPIIMSAESVADLNKQSHNTNIRYYPVA